MTRLLRAGMTLILLNALASAAPTTTPTPPPSNEPDGRQCAWWMPICPPWTHAQDE